MSDTNSTTKREAFLRSIVEPTTTAVLTMELQNGVVGPDAIMPALVDEVARTDLLGVVRRVCGTARDSGARVVHCTVVSRPDGAGGTTNCRIFALSDRMRPPPVGVFLGWPARPGALHPGTLRLPQ